MSFVADGIRIRRSNDFDDIYTVLSTQVNIDKDAKHIADLVWQFGKQACSMFNTYGFALVIAADDEDAALGIGKPAEMAH